MRMAGNQNKDLYQILDVAQGKAATPDEIKKAFRVAVMKHHPDRHGGSEEAKQKFQEINEANRVLSDEKLRSVYDRGGYQAVQDFEAGGSAPGSTMHAPSEAATGERIRKRYSEQQVWDFFANDGKPQTDAQRRPATPPAASETTTTSRPPADRSEAIRRRQEQMARATGGNVGTPVSTPSVDTRVLTRAFDAAGQKAAEAAADLRRAPDSPEAMTDEARAALDGAHNKARQLLSEIEGWKSKFKR